MTTKQLAIRNVVALSLCATLLSGCSPLCVAGLSLFKIFTLGPSPFFILLFVLALWAAFKWR